MVDKYMRNIEITLKGQIWPKMNFYHGLIYRTEFIIPEPAHNNR